MTIIKRSKLAILSIAFMLMIAGYINYKYNPEREKNLGQTVYVNGKDSFTYENVSIYSEDSSNGSVSSDIQPVQECIGNSCNDNEEVVTQAKEDDSIAVFRSDRDNMYSELSENYKNIINNSSTSKEGVNEYQAKLDELIAQKNLIAMVENVIKARGIEDIVIIPTNNDNINVIVKTIDELKPEQIAQIQQILVDQLGANASKISITSKM